MTQYHIGCSGWQYREWRQTFYPKELAVTHWFEYYSSIFHTVEINNSFYRYPTEKNLKHWYSIAPRQFKYTLKVNRDITHYKKFKNTKAAINKFYTLAEILAEKLGCILFQLPPNMIYNKELLDSIINQLDLTKNNVIEFRHSSWWAKEVYALLKQAKITFCSVNAPDLPKDFIYTNNELYLRIHGKKQWYKGDYANDLKLWIKEIQQQKPSHAWIYFNNDSNANAPNNAYKLLSICK